MGDHRLRGRRHWLAGTAAGAIALGLCGVALNPLFQGNGPIGAQPAAPPPVTLTMSPPPSPTPSVVTSPPVANPVVNLIADPGGDDGLTGWTVLEGGPAVVRYGTDGYPDATDRSRGAGFFTGGTVARSRLGQSVALPDGTGSATFRLTGLLGGFADQEDQAVCTLTFLDGDGQVLSGATLGPVTAADRHGETGLLPRTATGPVPAGARRAQVELVFTRAAGTANDGYADSLRLDVTAAADAK